MKSYLYSGEKMGVLYKSIRSEDNVTCVGSSLITHKLTQMRKKETKTKDFRQNLDEIGGLMAYEITRDLPTKEVRIETPVCGCVTKELEKDIVLVPILRAGLGMVNGICNLIPTVKVAHIGMYRDEETLQPHPYFEKYPKDMDRSIVMVVDPMLATGGSAAAAIDMVKNRVRVIFV